MNKVSTFLRRHKWIFLLLIATAFLRLYRINFPNTYVFDEVYHGFTAKEYLLNHKEAWEYWTTPPKGVAYEWTHPPLAKEIMALGMKIEDSMAPWAWRVPGALFGVLSVYMVYKLGLLLFKKETIALTSAFVFSLDGLNFVQSRTGMNDIYVVTFVLISLYFFLKKDLFLSALFIGLGLASKWSAMYMLGIYFLLLILRKDFKNIALFVCLPVLIYLLSYLPFFLLDHQAYCGISNPGQGCNNLEIFINLQRQMWWYHTNLKATHAYSSAWWSWPFNLYPVWYYVQYYPHSFVANIFASGNPPMFWMGFVAIIVTGLEWLKKRSKNLFIILLGYFGFWLPWAISPRIMFFYHYSPCVPFLSLALGYQLSKFNRPQKRRYYIAALVAVGVGFVLMYPFLTGVPLPRSIMLLFFKTNITKNPFI